MAAKTEAQRRRVQRIQDMRRSNAAEPHRSHKRYTRKRKHVSKGYDD